MSTKVKDFVKLLTPPVFLNVYRGIKYSSRLRLREFTWEHTYEHLRDVPVSGGGFESDTWMNTVRANLERVIAESKRDITVPELVSGEQSLLPVVAAMLSQFDKREKLSILDFGGGVGIDYVRLINSTLRSGPFDYHVVDTKSSCEMGSEFFADDERVHFYSSLPADLPEVELVYMNGALLYIEDYKSLLESLCDYRPKCFLFVRLNAGDIPTHARDQKNVEGSAIPSWFFNINEILEIMAAKGYSLVFKGVAEQIFDERNLPEQYRVKRGCSLLFFRD